MKENPCCDIPKAHLKLQHISNKKCIFLTKHPKINEILQTTLVAPGEKPYIIVTNSSSYAAYFDMINAIAGGQVLPLIILSSYDRMIRQVKEINTEMFMDLSKNILFPTNL